MMQQFAKLPLKSIEFDGEDSFSIKGDGITGYVYMPKDKIVFFNFELEQESGVEIHTNEIISIAQNVVNTIDERELVLDTLIDFGERYVAIFELLDERFQLPLPNTGAYISLYKDGTVASANFFYDEPQVMYPQEMISKDQARDILQQETLMKKSILHEPTWHYAYTLDHDIDGVSIQGEVLRISAWQEFNQAIYERLPSVPKKPFEQLLKGGNENNLYDIEIKDTYTSYYLSEEEIDCDDASEEDDGIPPNQLFIRACEIVRTLTNEQYDNYVYLKELDETNTFTFVYAHHGVYLEMHPITIELHGKGYVTSLTMHHIPYNDLATLDEPTISLEEANRIGRSLVDAKLAFTKTDIEYQTYELYYCMEFPPSDGHIKEINAYTGEVSFVETGFVKNNYM